MRKWRPEARSQNTALGVSLRRDMSVAARLLQPGAGTRLVGPFCTCEGPRMQIQNIPHLFGLLWYQDFRASGAGGQNQVIYS